MGVYTHEVIGWLHINESTKIAVYRHREEIDEYISDEIRKKIRHRNLRGGAK